MHFVKNWHFVKTLQKIFPPDFFPPNILGFIVNKRVVTFYRDNGKNCFLRYEYVMNIVKVKSTFYQI